MLLGVILGVPMLAAGRSPHVLFRADEIDVSFDDVRGAAVVVEEVVKTLNLFLAYKTFQERMGGNARRAILFEGPPGTGKTYLAKAMAKEAGVPFLFVSSSAFQSMYYGQTNRKIRSYFKALRTAARREGGAIGFIEEIDAIGAARSGMGAGSTREGISGVVNELLIQLQSFDQPAGGTAPDRLAHRARQPGPAVQPAHLASPAACTPTSWSSAPPTGPPTSTPPCCARGGSTARSTSTCLRRAGRRDIIDYYLAKKAHEPDLDDPARRDTLAAMTLGYSPVMIEHLLDEALVWALRRGAEHLNWDDIQKAKMTEEIGLAQPVAYTEAERRTIATHESGHATVAYLVGAGRKLEVLSVIKRKDALGLLAHSDTEERFTQTRTEILALIQIAFGGMVAEELFFGETSTGVAGDLQMATAAAAQMVGSLGMAGSLVSLEAASGPYGANIVAKVLATDDGRGAVEKILEDARSSVRTLLADNLYIVEALRDALLEHDELVGDEITDVISAARQAPVSDQTVPGVIDLR